MLSAVTKTISFLSAVGLTQATGGVDVSQRTYTDAWQCMKNEGNTFGIVRVYCSSGHPDENGPATINDAWSGGMSYVDGYIFPCYSCGNAAQQVSIVVNTIRTVIVCSSLMACIFSTDGRHHQLLVFQWRLSPGCQD